MMDNSCGCLRQLGTVHKVRRVVYAPRASKRDAVMAGDFLEPRSGHEASSLHVQAVPGGNCGHFALSNYAWL